MLLWQPRVPVDEGTDPFAQYFLPIGDRHYPELQVSIDWVNPPVSSGTPTWSDVTPYVRAWGFRRGAEHELSRISPGQATVLLDNRDGHFDPDYTGGMFYGQIKPMRNLQIRLRWDDVIYTVFRGLIQNYPVAWPHSGFDSTVAVNVIDAFSVLALENIVTDPATLVTPDITYSSKGNGEDGNALAVTYYVKEGRPGGQGLNESLNIQFSAKELITITGFGETHVKRYSRTYLPMTVIVALKQDSDGNVLTTAYDLISAIKAHSEVSNYLTAELTEGADDTAVLAPMEPTNLSGGTYAAEFPHTRVNNVLNDINWPDALRNIDTDPRPMAFPLPPGPTYRRRILAGISFSEEAEQSALNHLLDVDLTEGGRFFVDREGLIRFESRSWRAQNRTSQATLGEQTGELRYREIMLETEVDEIRNDVTIQSAHSVDDVHKEDSASIDDYQRRKESISLLTFDPLDAEAYANHMLYRYADPSSRTAEIETLPTHEDRWADVIGRDISDLVTRRRRPRYGGLNESEERIEAIRMEADGGQLRVYWQLSPALDDFWILGDSVRGVLGTTTVPGW